MQAVDSKRTRAPNINVILRQCRQKVILTGLC